MKESFDEYRNIIESNIMSISYLYSGDVISSSDDFYKSFVNHNKTSPKFIIDALDYIYEKSIESMISRSTEIYKIVDFEKLNLNSYWLYDIINGIENFNPKYIFISEKNPIKFGLSQFSGIKKVKSIKSNRPFPDYFYNVTSLKNMKLYRSPIIKEEEDEIIIYLTNKPIQSLVYSIQNMVYSINGNNHKLEYKFYKCDYISYKLVVKNLQKIRNDKIESILNF
jgi:hypothetical protein